VTGLKVPQAPFSVPHPILLYNDPYFLQISKHTFWLFKQ